MTQIANPKPQTDPFGNVTILTESGQMGAYRDSQWAGTIEINRDGLNHKDMVKDLVERAVREGHIYEAGTQIPFAAAQYVKLERDKKNPKLWHFVVLRGYLD